MTILSTREGHGSEWHRWTSYTHTWSLQRGNCITMTDLGTHDLFFAFYYSNAPRWISTWMGRCIYRWSWRDRLGWQDRDKQVYNVFFKLFLSWWSKFLFWYLWNYTAISQEKYSGVSYLGLDKFQQYVIQVTHIYIKFHPNISVFLLYFQD